MSVKLEVGGDGDGDGDHDDQPEACGVYIGDDGKFYRNLVTTEVDSSYKFRPAKGGTYTITTYLKDGQDPFEAIEQRGVIRGLRMAAEIVNARNASAIAGAILREAERLEREMKESET